MAKKSSKGSGKPLPKIEINLELTPEQGEELLKTLQVRFEKNMSRHDHVFVFHNSVPSFYAARGFRGSLKV